jgi:glycosyltransferase involved in cell wall biosynthesis
MRILHIISGLGVGGAETLLYRLIRESQGGGTEHLVISLSSLDAMAERIRSLGAQVRVLGMTRGVPQPRYVTRLVKWILAYKPDIVQTWMYHADLVGGFAAQIARQSLAWRGRDANRFGLLWGIHQTEFPTLNAGLKLGLTARFSAMASSRVPDIIVCCAEAARQSHVRGGYNAERMQVIRPGFDVERFRPLDGARESLRATLGIDAKTPLVGIVGRYHEVKDYGNFAAAISRVKREMPGCRYVMVGLDLDNDNQALRDLLAQNGVSDSVHLLGPRDNLQTLLPGLDVFCLSSRSEGFPTVVGEAMACGVPCVATNVGDTATLVGNAGRIVPREDAEALGAGLTSVLALSKDERMNLGELARHRIQSLFSIKSTWQQYEQAYGSTLNGAWQCAESQGS